MNQIVRIILPVVLLLICSHTVRATEEVPLEIKVKAAYIYNFLQFVKWPNDSENTTDICVYGVIGKYQSAIEAMIRLNKSDKTLTARYFPNDDNLQKLSACKVIFFVGDHADQQASIIGSLSQESSHNLIVGESGGFINNGGMINFIRVGDKIRFEINTRAVNQAGLEISSQVLRIAERIIATESTR